MKKSVTPIQIASVCFIVALCLLACNDRNKYGENTVESKLEYVTVGKLENIGSADGYLMDISANSAPYLVGKLYDLKTGSDGKITLISYNDFNYLLSSDKVDLKELDKDPDYEAYIKKGFTGKVGTTNATDLTSKIGSDDMLHVKYSNVFTCVAKGGFMDQSKLETDARRFNFKERIPNPVIVDEVTVKKLSHKQFHKLSGGLKAGVTALVNVEGNMYHEDGTTVNIMEVYVHFSEVLLGDDGKLRKLERKRLDPSKFEKLKIDKKSLAHL